MNSGEQTTWLIVAGVGASILFLLELSLAVVLVAVSALTRVAVQRVSGEQTNGLRFLSELKEPSSSYRTSLLLAKQLSLIGGCLLLGAMAQSLGLDTPWLIGLLAGAVFGILLLEVIAARVIALRNPRGALRACAPIVRAVHLILLPIVAPLAGILRRIEPPEQSEDDRETEQEEEVEAFIEAGEREGLLEKEEGKMMRGIVDLDETRVREIMTPRTDIVALSAEATVAEARSGVLDGGHSKLPVYQGTIDNVVGVMHARDLFRAWRDGHEEARVSDYARTVLFVPETLTAADLLREMRLRTQLAIVVDEYGGIAGLVTLEDLLEEIVGDIRDEHDPEESLVQQEQDGSWLVSALAHVRQIETLFEIDIDERDFDTVGGLVVSAFGRVPQGGEVIERYGLYFETLEADKRRVYRVRIRGPVPKQEQGDS